MLWTVVDQLTIAHWVSWLLFFLNYVWITSLTIPVCSLILSYFLNTTYYILFPILYTDLFAKFCCCSCRVVCQHSQFNNKVLYVFLCVCLCVCSCVFVIHSKIAQLMVKLFCFFGLDSESLWVSAAVAVRQKNSSISRNDLRFEIRCQRHIKRNKLAGEPSISGHINCLYCC